VFSGQQFQSVPHSSTAVELIPFFPIRNDKKKFFLSPISVNVNCPLFLTHNNHKYTGFGGLEVACWPLVPKFAGSNPAEAVGLFGRKNH
jgi:hypothetical protein